MNIGETKTTLIDAIDGLGGLWADEHGDMIKELIKQVEEQQKTLESWKKLSTSQMSTIESMKCCGNCKYYTFGCIRDFEACSGKHLLWESKQ